MATFVLVHGAWHGAWCWRRVTRLLTAHGHEVFAPTLTGVGERAHLLTPSVDLRTHITDVVNLMKWERLGDVVLVGHSYGGMVATGVAEEMQSAIGAIVFLDAFYPDNGQSLTDQAVKVSRDAIEAAARNGETVVAPRSRRRSGSTKGIVLGSTHCACRSRSSPLPRNSRTPVRVNGSPGGRIFGPPVIPMKASMRRAPRRGSTTGRSTICPAGTT